MSLLNTVKITNIPEQRADKYRGIATIGNVELSETETGKVLVKVPFEYENDKGREITFTNRAVLDPAWFEPSYSPLNPSEQERGTDESREAYAYQINMSKFVRKLFKEVGLDEIDFDQLEGKNVGIILGPESDKRDPSRQELKGLYKA